MPLETAGWVWDGLEASFICLSKSSSTCWSFLTLWKVEEVCKGITQWQVSHFCCRKWPWLRSCGMTFSRWEHRDSPACVSPAQDWTAKSLLTITAWKFHSLKVLCDAEGSSAAVLAQQVNVSYSLVTVLEATIPSMDTALVGAVHHTVLPPPCKG